MIQSRASWRSPSQQTTTCRTIEHAKRMRSRIETRVSSGALAGSSSNSCSSQTRGVSFP